MSEAPKDEAHLFTGRDTIAMLAGLVVVCVTICVVATTFAGCEADRYRAEKELLQRVREQNKERKGE